MVKHTKNGPVYSVKAPKGTEEGLTELMRTEERSLRKEKKDTKRTNGQRVKDTRTKGFQCHLGYSNDTQGNGSTVKHTRKWMATITTPSNPDGFIVKGPDPYNDYKSIIKQIPTLEQARVELKWTMKPYLLASINGNETFRNSKTVRKVIKKVRKVIKNLDPACYRKMKTIPSSVRFPCKRSLFTGITVTVLFASDPCFEVLGHIDDLDSPEAKGFSFRINTHAEGEGGLHVADGLTANPGALQGNIQRLPIGKINIAAFKDIPHAVYKPAEGESYAFNGYQKEAVLKSAKMMEEGAYIFSVDEKDKFKDWFDRTWVCEYCGKEGRKAEVRGCERACRKKRSSGPCLA